jgi:hypothetical protein
MTSLFIHLPDFFTEPIAFQWRKDVIRATFRSQLPVSNHLLFSELTHVFRGRSIEKSINDFY